MVMLVTNEDPFARSPHTVRDIVFFEALEAREHRGVFFRLGLFGAEGVVGEGIEADCFGLVAVERLREERRVGGLKSSTSNSRHLYSCGEEMGGLGISVARSLGGSRIERIERIERMRFTALS
jgi:hypothetical protein